MFDKKHERYWDNLDIDSEWKKILNGELAKDKKSNNAYYKNTRSSNKMTEELIYLLINSNQNESDDDCSSEKDVIEKTKKIAKVRYAIKCLTDKQRLAVELYFFQQKKQKEIAEIMGCKQRNVSDLISRSLKQITKKLNK